MREIKFKNDKIAFNIMAFNERYIICTRKLNKRADANILHSQVEMQHYSNFTEAYESQKAEPIYTIVDLKEGIRGPDNLVFGIYDYSKKEDCEKVIIDLTSGKIEISYRNRIDL